MSFTTKPSGDQLTALKAMLGKGNALALHTIDLRLVSDPYGLRWTGKGETLDLDRLVNVGIFVMRKRWPNFGLTGTLVAQGERIDDRWALTVEDGRAQKMPLTPMENATKCPCCGTIFEVEA